MTADPDERDLRAAEYVLGTLPASERAAMDLELTVDPAAKAAVTAWERRLAPLCLVLPDIVPDPRVWAAIVRALPAQAAAALGPAAAALAPAQVAATPANDNRIRDLARTVRRWRLVAGAASALAAGLALFIAIGGRPAERGDGRYVAVINRGGEAPALIVSIDTAAGIARVRPVGAETPAGKSLELWYVGAGQAPRTLGLIGTDAKRLSLPDGSDRAKLGDGLFAVSVEPPTGSPTGQPTGPVVYTGKLIRD